MVVRRLSTVSNKTTLRLLSALGMLIPLCALLRSSTEHDVFVFCALPISLLTLGFLGYAWFRESELGDRSETLSPHYTALVLGGLGLWVAFVFFRAFVR